MEVIQVETKPESQTHGERDHESVEVKRLRRLAKEHKVRTIHSKLQKARVVGAKEHRRGMKTSRKICHRHCGQQQFVFGRKSSLLVNMDDENSKYWEC